ncbi:MULTISPECIES: glycosyltransferase [unclassified Roseovarius]|uniref:glycosyltransferase n=1 Tax=unclassified Roseovarius TaxID=2614913 RepID=UPI00273D947C|nr:MULTISPECIES: glycosyltransferase [unclassified Roseovarius]
MAAPKYRASILLLAYNQENFIRDAVNCALAQDASDLEIILSDDSSSDATFQIMQEMATGYDGPHTLRLNRNRKNLGVNNHINFLVEMASADVCVPFPADDTSVPHRVSRLLEVMERDDALLVHSDASTIDGAGNPAEESHKHALFYHSEDIAKAALSDALFLGATSAYRKELWQKYGPLPAYSKAFEDLITGFRAALEGRISYVDEQLVCYRQDVGISNVSNSQYRLESMAASRKRRQQRFWARKALFEQRLKDARTFGLPDDSEVIRSIEAEIEKVRHRGDFYAMPWLKFLRTYGRVAVKVTLSELNYIVKRK